MKWETQPSAEGKGQEMPFQGCLTDSRSPSRRERREAHVAGIAGLANEGTRADFIFFFLHLMNFLCRGFISFLSFFLSLFLIRG